MGLYSWDVHGRNFGIVRGFLGPLLEEIWGGFRLFCVQFLELCWEACLKMFRCVVIVSFCLYDFVFACFFFSI